MSYLIIFFIFVFGAIVGSFLNVVACRLNTGKGLGGRSACFSCGNQLRFWELIPVLSYLWQKGRCRTCCAKISKQYFVVEMCVGLLFVFLAYRFAGDAFATTYFWLVFSLLTVIVIYDWRHKIIPDVLVYLFCLLALAGALVPWLMIGNGWFDSMLGGGILFLFFWALWYFSDGRWMGFGDAKLALGIGILLGLAGGVSAIVLAFWLGAFVGLILVWFGKRKSGRHNFKSEVPFAPFMVAGLLISILFNINVFLF